LCGTEDERDHNDPAHVACAGNEHLLLAVRTRRRLADLHYDYPALQTLMNDQGWTTVHLFWAETPTLFHARNPFPPGGSVEDPATRSPFSRDMTWEHPADSCRDLA